jgi:hypothetical protein
MLLVHMALPHAVDGMTGSLPLSAAEPSSRHTWLKLKPSTLCMTYPVRCILPPVHRSTDAIGHAAATASDGRRIPGVPDTTCMHQQRPRQYVRCGISQHTMSLRLSARIHAVPGPEHFAHAWLCNQEDIHNATLLNFKLNLSITPGTSRW